MTIRLASFDMAGTTVEEHGTVYRVLRHVVESSTGSSVPDELLAGWSGTDKRQAIAGLLAALGEDVGLTDRIFGVFTAQLDAEYAAVPPTLLPGVRQAVERLRVDGVAVALQTGYTRDVAEGLLSAIGWRVGDDVDALVTADEVTRSRPAPYLVFRTMEATGVDDVREVLVAGDTVNDLRAGTAAGARLVIGVLTGAHDATRLEAAAHTHLLPSAAAVPDLLAEAGELPGR